MFLVCIILLFFKKIGTSQLYPLPCSDFKFLRESEYSQIDWLNVDLMGETGYFIECSLIYPEEIQNKTMSYPLCPENINISEEMLSPFQKQILKDEYGKTSYTSKKLTCTFLPKKDILLHGLNLQLYLQSSPRTLPIRLLDLHP